MGYHNSKTSLMKALYRIAVVILFLLISAIVLFKCNNPFKKKVQEIRTEQAVKQDQNKIAQIKYVVIHDTTTKYIKGGIVYSTKMVASGNNRQLSLFYKGKFDSICREYNLTRKQLDNSLEANIGAFGDISSSIDPDIEGYTVPFNDCFIKGLATIDRDVSVMNMKYTATIHLEGVRYWKRPHHFWFIKWGMPIFKDVLHTNCPNVVVDSITDIRIEHKNFLTK